MIKLSAPLRREVTAREVEVLQLVRIRSDWRRLPTTTDVLLAGGWTWRGITVWNKTTSRPSRGRFRMGLSVAHG